MDEKQALVPRLRFPEFRDAGEWREHQLTEIANLHKGKGISKADIKETGRQPCIRYGELYTVYGDVISEVVSKTDVPPDDLFMSREGDVIIPSSGETKIDIATAACVLRENIALGGDLNVIRSEQNGVFLSYYLNGSLKHEIAKVAQGDTVVHLYKSNLEALKLAIPKAQEQRKIADCLSSLDALIAAQADKIAALKTHKKGLMQQLFPREGETVPRLRFPEFRDAGEWRNYRLDDVSPAIFDGTHQTPKYVEEGVPFFSVENIVSGNKNKFISKAAYAEATKKNKPEKGDVLITRIGKIGFSTIVSWDYEFSIYVTLAVVKKSNNFDSRFLHFCFQSESYQAEILSKSLLNAVPCKINMDELRGTKLLLPPEKEEQQRIADCLSSLDGVINAHAEKLDALKTHKKGLMQQLFPSTESVGV